MHEITDEFGGIGNYFWYGEQPNEPRDRRDGPGYVGSNGTESYTIPAPVGCYDWSIQIHPNGDVVCWDLVPQEEGIDATERPRFL